MPQILRNKEADHLFFVLRFPTLAFCTALAIQKVAYGSIHNPSLARSTPHPPTVLARSLARSTSPSPATLARSKPSLVPRPSRTPVLALFRLLDLAFLLNFAILALALALSLLEARARDELDDVAQKQVLVLAPKHSLQSRVGWSGVGCWLVG